MLLVLGTLIFYQTCDVCSRASQLTLQQMCLPKCCCEVPTLLPLQNYLVDGIKSLKQEVNFPFI